MLKTLSLWMLGLFFVVAGINHFRTPALYVAMMPPSLPQPAGLSAFAGACEILGGAAVLVRGTRRMAGWGLIALLIAVFPANVHAALAGYLEGPHLSSSILWLRLPAQGVLVAWVYWVALARPRSLGI
jgi:uncharacterized membrane protein